MTEKIDSDHEDFLHDEEFFVEKNEKGEMVSIKRPVDFDQFPGAIKLDQYPEIENNPQKNNGENEEVENLLTKETPIGTFNGQSVYPSDANDFYLSKEKLVVKDGVENIFETFKQKEKEFKRNNDSRHILLLKRGTYIQGYGSKYRKYGGDLNDHCLAVVNKEYKNSLEIIHSFNTARNNKIQINYLTDEHSFEPCQRRKVNLDPKIKINKNVDHIDLNKEDINSLRDKLAKKIKE